MTLRAVVVTTHRRVGLTAAAFWLLRKGMSSCASNESIDSDIYVMPSGAPGDLAGVDRQVAGRSTMHPRWVDGALC
jgi:hypothetical protein